MKMLTISTTFVVGFVVGAIAYHRTRRADKPKRGMTRHTFHVDLPDGEMCELAERPYYNPASQRCRI